MDQFYLKNAALYQTYVDKLDPTKPPSHFMNLPPQPTNKTADNSNPNMTISVRIRPMLEDDIASGFPCAIYPRPHDPTAKQQTLDLHDLYNHPRRPRPILKSSTHKLQNVFDASASTAQVYDEVVRDLVISAADGKLGTLFAYGQTSSGKTFTVTELQKLAVADLLDRHSELHVTVVELAGNVAFDLFNQRERIAVLEDATGTTQLVGAIEHQITTKSQGIELLEKAMSFRRAAPTLKNPASSRSHCICRIKVTQPDASTHGFLYMVDLAGSEIARDVTEHGPELMRETRENNVSLSVLKDCIRQRALAATSKKKVHVPVRGSTLTKILKHVFDPEGGQECKTVVIACLNPSLADVASSKNTLRYAELLGKID
ncbi:P-loop containing nucleoside triphosphate hydrolase protein, partial [Aureobasidium melanogenum]